jgi:hypothetical protein
MRASSNSLIHSRSDIIDLIYSEYLNSEGPEKNAVQKVRTKLLSINESEFINICRKSHIILQPIRKNYYYIKIS